MIKKLSLNPDGVTWREIDGEVLALGASTYFSTTGCGMLLWRALAEGATRDELVGMVARQYVIAHGEAAADVDAFLESLAAHGLLAER